MEYCNHAACGFIVEPWNRTMSRVWSGWFKNAAILHMNINNLDKELTRGIITESIQIAPPLTKVFGPTFLQKGGYQRASWSSKTN